MREIVFGDTLFNADKDRIKTLSALEAAAVMGPFSVQSEYISTTVQTDDPAISSDPDFSGWYVYGSWFITGESRAYKTSSGTFDRIKPKSIVGKGGTGSVNQTGGQIIELMFELSTRRRATLVLITHDRELAGRCRRNIQVADGLVIERGGGEEANLEKPGLELPAS